MPEAFDYYAWLENRELPPDDEDYEWCAHIVVLADAAELARSWGDTIVRDLCAETVDVFLRSSVDPHVRGMAMRAGEKHSCPNFPALSRPGNEMLAMPVVLYGEPATADYIGW